MRLKIVVVDVGLPATLKRWVARIGIFGAMLAGASAIAHASTVPTIWTAGQPLKSADLNANFASMDSRVSTLESAAPNYAAATSVTSLGQRVTQLESAVAAGDTPQQVVTNFNAAVAGGAAVTLGAITPAAVQFDLRWMMQHAAVAAACAAASPTGDSPSGHVVLPKPAGVTCTAACAATTGGAFTNCRTGIAVGEILPTEAQAYTDIVSHDYNYGCGDNQSYFDEVLGDGLAADAGAHPSSFYTEYCCCYR
jgi:hypothetical protein